MSKTIISLHLTAWDLRIRYRKATDFDRTDLGYLQLFRFESCRTALYIQNTTSGPLISAVTTAAQSSQRTCPLTTKEFQ